MVKKQRKMHSAITEQEFNKIQEMLNIPMTVRQVAKFTGWSTGGVGIWKRYGTWDKYCAYKAELLSHYKSPDKKNGLIVPGVAPHTPASMNPTYEGRQIDQILALLAEVNFNLSKLYGLELKKYNEKLEYFSKKKSLWSSLTKSV